MKIHISLAALILLTSCEISINKDHVAEGTRLMNQGDYFNADVEFDDALYADNNNLDALRGSYYCALNLGNNEKALRNANKFIELRPDSSVGYSDRGLLYQIKKDHEKALADFNTVIAKGTDYPAIAYFNKGEALRELKRFEEAIICYNVVIGVDAKDARAYFKKGLSFLQIKNKDSACIALNIAKKLGDPDSDAKLKENCQ